VEKVEEVLAQLKQLNGTADKMLSLMSRSPNRALQVLTIAAAVAGALGIVSAIDQIVRWIGG
jgi:hypothetical protein